MMKRLICLVLLVSLVLPVFAKRVTEINTVDLENLIQERNELREEAKPDKTVKYGLVFFGTWGIVTWGVTGGLYPFVTGSLFLWGAISE